LKVEDLRKTFSKGMVSTSDNVVIALYSFNDRWFSQGIEEEEKDSLIELIHQSDSFMLHIDKGKSIKAVFRGDYGLGEMKVNEILRPEITTKELDDMIMDLEFADPYGLTEEFKDMDFDNEDHKAALFERLGEVLQEALKKEGMPFRNRSKYLEMLDIIQTFSGKALKDAEANPPDELSGGYIDITFGVDDMPIVIQGEKKDSIERLVGISSCVAVEGNVNEGIVSITFFI